MVDNVKYELDLDVATDFFVKQYCSDGYHLHFHRNIEIYGVVEGEVLVTIAGESRLLTPGQIAVVNCTEAHKYTISKTAEVFSVISARHILRILFQFIRINFFLVGLWIRSTIKNY